MIRPKRLPVPNLCLVTGAANGIGLAFSRQLVTAGSKVVAMDIDVVALTALAEEYPEYIISLNADLSNPDHVAKILDQLAEICVEHGAFQIAVMNAAISATGPFEKLDATSQSKIIELNTITPLIMSSQMVARGFMDKGSAMIFMSSLSHKTGYPGAATYAASKDALAIYAKSVRAEFARHNVHVMSVFPGPVNTQMASRHAPEGSTEKGRMDPDKLAKQILLEAHRGNDELYPGALVKLTAFAGTVFPRTLTQLMRKIIFERLPTPE